MVVPLAKESDEEQKSTSAPGPGWRELARLQIPRRDFPKREFLLILFLIAVIWVLDVFVLSKAYDENYFVVQRTVRKAGRHCRDMVINKKGTLTYEVDTCGKRYTYEVHGKKAIIVDVVEIEGDPRKR